MDSEWDQERCLIERAEETIIPSAGNGSCREAKRENGERSEKAGY